MSEELKPVHCGCGGEAKIETDHDTVVPGEPIDWKRVRCNKCNIRTTWRKSEAEAIQAWNRVMGATDTNVGDKFAKDMNVPRKERTAKVVCHETTMGLSFCCGNCGKPVHSEGKYCHHCGARLDWE